LKCARDPLDDSAAELPRLSFDRKQKLNLTQKKDCLYELTTTFETGYNGTEIKFVVNDSLEFENKESRRIKFAITDTTFYNATFNAR
jgi:hypothetical protein